MWGVSDLSSADEEACRARTIGADHCETQRRRPLGVQSQGRHEQAQSHEAKQDEHIPHGRERIYGYFYAFILLSFRYATHSVARYL